MSATGSSRLWGKITVLIAVCGWALSAQAKYSGGTGEPNNPYRLSEVSDWQELAATPADWASDFVLTADIDLNDVPITPVGSDPSWFTGVFDGNDYVIRNADMNMPGSDYVGLFGRLAPGGQIKNLGVEDISIFGEDYVGGLVGATYGAISNCYSTGSVTGTGYAVGGLLGAGSRMGRVSNSLWDVNTSGWATSAGGAGKTTDEMQDINTFLEAGWDFVEETANGTDDIWRMCVDGVDYPRLTWEYVQGGATKDTPHAVALKR